MQRTTRRSPAQPTFIFRHLPRRPVSVPRRDGCHPAARTRGHPRISPRTRPAADSRPTPAAMPTRRARSRGCSSTFSQRLAGDRAFGLLRRHDPPPLPKLFAEDAVLKAQAEALSERGVRADGVLRHGAESELEGRRCDEEVALHTSCSARREMGTTCMRGNCWPSLQR